MPRRPTLTCGQYFCPAPLRLLYPIKAVPAASVARIYGCGLSEVERRAHKLGVFDLRPHRRVMVYSAAAFRAAWADPDLTVAEIAARFGMLDLVAGQHARRLGLPPRIGGAPRAAFGPAFDRHWRDGVRTRVMAAIYGCHPDTVLREARRRGLSRRKRGSAKLGADHLLQQVLARSAAETHAALRDSEMIDPPSRVAIGWKRAA